jgi:uncharacterized phiE125 gp8 family phage protein
MFAPRLITPPATTPVSVSDVKAHLDISGATDDQILTSFIAAVMGMIDGYGGYLGRCVVAQQWAQDYRGWPCDRILLLPFPDCSAATLSYRDQAHANQTMPSAGHSAPIKRPGGDAVVIYGETALPALSNRPGPVSAAFTAGFATVPEAIRQAVILETAALYARRGRDPTLAKETVFGVSSMEWTAPDNDRGQAILASNAARNLLAPYVVKAL